jgi:hypothetical protein
MHCTIISKEEMEKIEKKIHKLKFKRNILFRTFAINYAAILFVWLFSMTGVFHWTVASLVPALGAGVDMYMLWMIGLWKIAAFVFFLAPALGLWWEMHCMKKMVK